MQSDPPDSLYYAHNSLYPYVSLRRWVAILTFAAFFFEMGCKPNNTVQLEGLYGKWDIQKALRNGNETPYLRGGYFVIEQNGTMIVNITGTEEKGKFELDNNTLSLDEKKNFIVESMANDSLSLRYIMNEENIFLFYLTKKKDEVQ